MREFKPQIHLIHLNDVKKLIKNSCNDRITSYILKSAFSVKPEPLMYISTVGRGFP